MNASAEYAGFWIRLLATLIDSLILVVIITPALLLIYGEAYLESAALLRGPADFLLSYVLPAVAVIIFWVYKSATPGKMIVSVAIVDAETGGRPSVARFVVRYFAYMVSAIPLGLGFLWIAFDKRKQGWHDKLAGTVVVRRPTTRTPEAGGGA